jgi:hypothetical protein
VDKLDGAATVRSLYDVGDGSLVAETVKPAPAGLGIQSLGRHYDESELGKPRVYCIAVNTAATSASTRDQTPEL